MLTAAVIFFGLLLLLILVIYYKPTLFYKCLLMILHYMYLTYKLCILIPLFLQRKPKAPINSLQMEKDLKNLDKIPKHLAVLFWGKIEEKRLKEAAQLCCWAWRSGVKMLSIYDVEDDLKHNAQLLQFHIDAFSKHFFIHEKFVPIIRVTALGISTKYSNNEDSNLPDMHVNLISYADGRTRIVEVTKNFSEEVKQGKMISDELDVEELDRRLSVPQFSEPQLLILFSPKVELEGFPPWHIRLTEIFHIPGNYDFHYSLFIKGLRKYSKCDQRFGR